MSLQVFLRSPDKRIRMCNNMPKSYIRTAQVGNLRISTVVKMEIQCCKQTNNILYNMLILAVRIVN